MTTPFHQLVTDVLDCRLCADTLPCRPRPILQIDQRARILIAGQAPGARAHQSGIPFDDLSGDRLRSWMGIDRDVFYDKRKVAVLPMGFCYPGTGERGDLPPSARCAQTWRRRILGHLTAIELTLVIGQYAQKWHLDNRRMSLTERVRAWQIDEAPVVPLPHPSPRNNLWLKKNPWFEASLLPSLRLKVADCLSHNIL